MTDSNNDSGVIFDLDGVLVDTAEYHRRAWYDLAEKENLRMSDEFFENTFGSQNAQIIPEMTDRRLSDEDVERMSQWKEARYREHVDGNLQLLDGAGELIKDLKANGFRLAIGTSTPRINLEFLLENMPLHEYFDDYVTGEDVENGKPAPDTFLAAAEKLCLPAGRCVVIEDSVQGVTAGKSAGMKVIAVTTTRKRENLTQADITVASLDELDIARFHELLWAD